MQRVRLARNKPSVCLIICLHLFLYHLRSFSLLLYLASIIFNPSLTSPTCPFFHECVIYFGLRPSLSVFSTCAFAAGLILFHPPLPRLRSNGHAQNGAVARVSCACASLTSLVGRAQSFDAPSGSDTKRNPRREQKIVARSIPSPPWPFDKRTGARWTLRRIQTGTFSEICCS